MQPTRPAGTRCLHATALPARLRRAPSPRLTSFLFVLAVATCSSFAPGAAAGERLTSEELREVLVGNTESGYYKYESPNYTKSVPYSEYYAPDGSIRGVDRWQKYDGRWEVRDEGCFYRDYDGSDYDGCSYYYRESDNEYRVDSPGFEGEGPVTITRGNS